MLGALAGLIEQDNHPKSIKVSDFIAHNQWSTGNEDRAIWTPDHTGSFSSISAWNALRQTNNSCLTNTKIWHDKLPFKVSSFSDLLGNMEILMHIQIEGTKPSSISLIHKTTYLIQLILTSQFPSPKTHSNFRNICLMTDSIKPKLDINPVRWNAPKLIPEILVVGGILRNHLGHMIMAFTAYSGYSSNNLAEARAIKIGLGWCIDHGFNTLTSESDSMIAINMINKVIASAWSIMEVINAIHSLLTEGSFQFNHIFRERNSTADLLANYH
ncbi:hypothetical protein R3W88_028580 [Solanum pinnatisectum]|uniref:RNase H type-1 domain-containing protein n=1 Tax=Solanum pinnatisectum TaxID=50273 RepID=A0AAV9K4N3_9SOLN|nr:hypothetical protein R3W88_028580 [Solanum pinnatisectum]